MKTFQGDALPSSLALQWARDAAGASLLMGEASLLQSWGPHCHQQWPWTAEISCRQRDPGQQRSQPLQSWHKRGNAQEKENEARDSSI